MARNFNGGTDRIAFDGLPAQGSGLYAFAFRFKTTQVTVNAMLAARWGPTSRNGWGLILNNTLNKILLQNYNSTGTVLSIAGTTTVNDGVWHDAILNSNAANAGTSQVHIDGALDISGSNSAALGGSGAFLQFGDNFDPFWPTYVGDIADTGAWSGINLNADEIAAYHKGFSACQIRPQNLDYYAPFGRDYQDRMGNPIGTSGFSGTTVVDHPRVVGSLA